MSSMFIKLTYIDGSNTWVNPDHIAYLDETTAMRKAGENVDMTQISLSVTGYNAEYACLTLDYIKVRETPEEILRLIEEEEDEHGGSN